MTRIGREPTPLSSSGSYMMRSIVYVGALALLTGCAAGSGFGEPRLEDPARGADAGPTGPADRGSPPPMDPRLPTPDLSLIHI